MKPTFAHRPLNGTFEDPCLFVRLLRERRALLFDLGTVYRLPPAEILKVTDIFVTHTHIDHFIGFDHVLRILLGRDLPLSIYGPSNIIECVCGKLRGYTWNLIKEYPLKIEVFGISADKIRHTSFHARESFEPVEREADVFEGMALRDSFFKVKAAILEHDIDSVAYSLEEDYHINIDKDALLSMGLDVGPWLTGFKRALRAGAPDDTVLEVHGRDFTIGALRDRIAIFTEGQKVTYIMDASPTQENTARAVELAGGSHTLYIEAYFLHEDLERARDRRHLTARLAGLIARNADVQRLVLMHHSPKYRLAETSILKEAGASFGGPVTMAGY
jgi:ribonuclease Z